MTCSAADSEQLAGVRRRIFLALFTALAVALHTLEFLLPSPAPWFRLGLANTLALTALFLYGGRAAWHVNLGRILVGSLVVGNLFAPGFFLSLGGGVAATALMTGSRALFGRHIGPVGVSLLGAAGHAAGQVLLARMILIQHPGLWNLFPFFLLFSLGSGLATGVAAAMLVEVLQGHPAFAGLEEKN